MTAKVKAATTRGGIAAPERDDRHGPAAGHLASTKPDAEPGKGGWPRVSIGDSLNLINGRAFKPTEWKKSGTPIVRIQNLNNPNAPFNYFQGDLAERFLIEDEDLLFAWSGTPGTSFGAHIWRGGRAWLNQHIFKVRFDETQFDRRFLQLAINQNLSDYIRAAHGGAGLAHITKGRFEESELPQPVLPEQRRIVAEIDKQFTRLDAGVAALRRVQAKLKRYRAAVLKAACDGRLVPTEADLDATEREAPAVETGEELLARILRERRQSWQGRGSYSEPAAPVRTNLPALPKGWTWTSVAQLLRERLCNGVSVKGSDDPPGVRALRLSAMSESGFDYSDARYLPLSGSQVDDLWIQEGDFFVSRGNGSLPLVGRGTRAQEPPQSTIFPDTMIRLRLASPMRQSRWVETIWPSRVVRSQIEARVKTTAGIYKISQPQVEAIVVPLPPLAEQARIVAEVERRLSVVAELEAVVAANLQRAARLRQSILQRAFAGMLV